MKVGGKHKKKTQIRVRGDKALRVRKLLEIWKKDTGPDMAQVWPMLDHSLNAMICEWYVESGRFYMYQYMTRGWVKMKESRVMRIRSMNWRSSKQRVHSYFFLFKRINMWYHDAFHYFLSIYVRFGQFTSVPVNMLLYLGQ